MTIVRPIRSEREPHRILVKNPSMGGMDSITPIKDTGTCRSSMTCGRNGVSIEYPRISMNTHSHSGASGCLKPVFMRANSLFMNQFK